MSQISRILAMCRSIYASVQVGKRSIELTLFAVFHLRVFFFHISPLSISVVHLGSLSLFRFFRCLSPFPRYRFLISTVYSRQSKLKEAMV